MLPFTFHNPTKLIFGDGQLAQLEQEVSTFGKTVLLVYGGGSIKANGLYSRVMQHLSNIQATVLELPGVEPNPRISTVRKGVQLCKEHGVDLILAVGGGSVIDCCKAIAVGAKSEEDAWDIITRKKQATDALPIGTVLTLAATGSEMNASSVITNWETNEKIGWGSPHVYPRFSILEPKNTVSVPENQTVYGIVDIMSHVFEQYFRHTDNVKLQDRYCEGLLRTVIETAPELMKDLTNLQHRETILYCGTMALNGTISMGAGGDWASHNIEHAVSAVYDIPHGGGLAILFPNWMKHVMDEGIDRFKQFAVRVFDIDPAGKSDREVAEQGIEALRNFWNSIGAPSRLADYDIDDSKFDIMLDHAMAGGPFGHFKKLEREDVRAIYTASL